VTLTLRPAPTDTGVVFVNRNGHAGATLAASVDHLVPTELCTAISGNGFQVKTIEHVLAALAGLSVDNVFVDIDAAEAPVMDGSSAPFVRLIQSAGVRSPKPPSSLLEDYPAAGNRRWISRIGSSRLPRHELPIRSSMTIR
jgi:UDP-3-O-[3-hydroxymyristoyl] N-acetylglucosamine deacetylase